MVRVNKDLFGIVLLKQQGLYRIYLRQEPGRLLYLQEKRCRALLATAVHRNYSRKNKV